MSGAPAFLKRSNVVVIDYVDTRTYPWKRLGYHGLFSVRDVEIDDYVLTFWLTRHLANLHRPSERTVRRNAPIIKTWWSR